MLVGRLYTLTCWLLVHYRQLTYWLVHCEQLTCWLLVHYRQLTCWLLVHYRQLTCWLVDYRQLTCWLVHYRQLTCWLVHYRQLTCWLVHCRQLTCWLLHWSCEPARQGGKRQKSSSLRSLQSWRWSHTSVYGTRSRPLLHRNDGGSDDRETAHDTSETPSPSLLMT